MTPKQASRSIYDEMKFGEGGGCLIQRIEIDIPRKQIVFHAIYDPDRPETTFSILFENGYITHWEKVSDEETDQEVDTADVIGFDFYESEMPHNALIHTDLFEISLIYDTYALVKHW